MNIRPVVIARSLALAAFVTSVTATAQGTAAFDRSKPPALGPAPSLSVPAAVERTLPNGLRLIIVEHHELPVADFSLIVKTGGEADPSGKTGLATLAATLLTKGAGTRGAPEIAEQQAFLGARLGAFSGWDQSVVTLSTTTAVLDSALALFADVALRPTFPVAEFDREKTQRMTQLMQVKDRGPAIADRAFSMILFGENHPYGQPLAGIEATVETLSRDDVAAFYRTYYRPNNALLMVVGDVTPADIERRLTALFGRWERATVPAVNIPAPPARTDRRIYVVDKPAAPQASFRIGAPAVARSTPDYYPLQVMNTILGGSFTSRLNNNLRETKGYTYGASSGFGMRKEPGPFVSRAEIVAEKSDSALVEFVKELENIRRPVPAEELDKAKKYMQLGLPSGFETTSDIAGQLASFALYDLPLDEPARAVGRIGAVTAADVQRVATRYLDPQRMAIVISGDAASLIPLLRATGIAPVERRDSYGKAVIAQ